jgi:hypothetical protein
MAKRSRPTVCTQIWSFGSASELPLPVRITLDTDERSFLGASRPRPVRHVGRPQSGPDWPVSALMAHRVYGPRGIDSRR